MELNFKFFEEREKMDEINLLKEELQEINKKLRQIECEKVRLVEEKAKETV